MTLILSGTDNSVSSPAVQGGTAGTTTGVYYPATNQVALATNGTLGLIQDASQNLGVGVTPSTWITGQGKVLEVGYVGNSFWGRFANENHIGQNYYNNSSGLRTYASTNPASDYQQYNGTHTWYTAASGTAGNAVTFTQSLAVGKGTTLALEGATSAAGTGITFPATQSASSDANTLDDYEEGTWTPSVSLGTITYGNPVYTKVGRLVTVSTYIQAFSDRTTATAVAVYGLPFTTGTSQSVGPMFMRQSNNSVTACYAGAGQTYFNFYGTTSGAYAPLLHSQLNAANTEIYFSLTYMV